MDRSKDTDFTNIHLVIITKESLKKERSMEKASFSSVEKMGAK